jgi:hypothetical protein
MGSSCAVADVQEHRATVWSATQSVDPTQRGVSLLTGLPLDNLWIASIGLLPGSKQEGCGAISANRVPDNCF